MYIFRFVINLYSPAKTTAKIHGRASLETGSKFTLNLKDTAKRTKQSCQMIKRKGRQGLRTLDTRDENTSIIVCSVVSLVQIDNVSRTCTKE